MFQEFLDNPNPNSDREQSDYIKARIGAIRIINEFLSKMIERKIELSNFGQKHPNSYAISVDDKITNIVIGWEDLMYMQKVSEVEELAENIKERLKEIEE